MTHYEYRVLPAPEKGLKAKGVKGAKARFALAIETLINEMGAEGWEYQRADTLPSEERAGLTQSVTEWRTLLVFRRARRDQAEDFQPRELPRPAEETPEAEARAEAHDREATGPEDMAEPTPTEADSETPGEDTPRA